MNRIDGREHIRFSNQKQQKNNKLYQELHERKESPKQPAANINAIRTGKEEQGLNISLDRENLINGIILSEILGRPKAFRRGHRGF